MPVVADASVAIRGDLKPWRADLRSAERETQGLGAKIRSALSPKNVIGAAGLLGIGLGIRQLAGFVGDAAGEFQELRQTAISVDRIFGDSAATIRAWGEQAASSAGLSKREVFEAASVMGQTLLNMGFSAEDAADQVVTLQQRAADLALAFGKDPQDALLAFSAALRGERDTIEKFGVTLTQGLVDARIKALNLSTATPELERYATAVATLSLVMEQSENSAGRFVEGQDKVEVKMAQAKANAQNLEAQFGQMVTEIENGAFIVGDTVVDAFSAAGQGIEDFFKVAFDPRNQQLADALGIPVAQAQEMISESMMVTGQDFDATVEGMLQSAYQLGEEGAESFDHFTAAFTAMRPPIDEAADGIARAIPDAVKEHWEEIRQAGIDTMNAYNAGIFSSQSSFLSEIDNLLKLLDENLAPAEEIAELRGKKIELFLARGIAVDKGDAGAVAAIDDMIDQINQRLNTLNGYDTGTNIDRTIAAGLYAESWRVGQAAGYVASKIQGPLQIRSEPPDPASPLRGITQWGGNIVKTIAEGIYGDLDAGSAAAAALASTLVPPFAGRSLGMTPGVASAVPAGGDTFVLNVNGVPRTVHTAQEAVDTLVEMSDFSDGRVR